LAPWMGVGEATELGADLPTPPIREQKAPPPDFRGVKSRTERLRRRSAGSLQLARVHDLGQELRCAGEIAVLDCISSEFCEFSTLLLLFAERLRETTFRFRFSVGESES
jgi:hypothetical protein